MKAETIPIGERLISEARLLGRERHYRGLLPSSARLCGFVQMEAGEGRLDLRRPAPIGAYFPKTDGLYQVAVVLTH
jgi:hypothetical protein